MRVAAALRGGILAAMAATLAAPAPAQLFWTMPNFAGQPVKGDEPGIALPLPGATAKELDANLMWNLRAGLNVAALQCQFSPTLRTVKNYNDIIAHHAKELQGAFNTLQAYFSRTKGKGRPGQTAFDQYTTRTYNGFSTLHAQLGFCETAALIGRDAISRPKGQLLPVARTRMREFRNSLVPARDALFNRVAVVLPALPGLDEACWNRGRYVEKACGYWAGAMPAEASSDKRRR